MDSWRQIITKARKQIICMFLQEVALEKLLFSFPQQKIATKHEQEMAIISSFPPQQDPDAREIILLY